MGSNFKEAEDQGVTEMTLVASFWISSSIMLSLGLVTEAQSLMTRATEAQSIMGWNTRTLIDVNTVCSVPIRLPVNVRMTESYRTD